MRKLEDILNEIKEKGFVKGIVFGKYANNITSDDVAEWENSSAGIDTCKRSEQCVTFQ
jgi:hypothetical protein